MNCKLCKSPIISGRVDLGFTICTSCSTEPKWSGVPIVNHKTGNTIQIVKDPEDAAEFFAKSARIGFGTSRGLSNGYKRKNRNIVPHPVNVEPKPVVDRVLSRRPAPHEFDAVGTEVMGLLDKSAILEARQHIRNALAAKRIFTAHAVQLDNIVKALSC